MSDSNIPPLWLQVPEPCDLVRKLGTVAAFFRRLKSTAEHLDEKARRYVVLRCAFRKLLMPEPTLGAVIPLR